MLAAFAQFLLLFVINHNYGLADSGRYLFAIAVVSPLHVFLLGGIRQVVLGSEVSIKAIYSVRAFTILGYIVFIAICSFVSSANNNLLFIAVVVLKLGEHLQMTYAAFLASNRRYRKVAIFYWSYLVALIACSYGFINLGAGVAEYLLACSLISLTFGCVLFIDRSLVRVSVVDRISFNAIISLVRKMAIVGLSAFIASLIVNYPKSILATSISPEKFGYIGTILYIFIVGQIVNSGWLGVSIPNLRAQKESNRNKRFLSQFLLICFVYLFFGVILYANFPLVELILFGDHVDKTLRDGVLELAGIYIYIALLTAFIESYSTVFKKEKLQFLSNIIILVIVLCVSTFVVGDYGFLGYVIVLVLVMLIKAVILFGGILRDTDNMK